MNDSEIRRRKLLEQTRELYLDGRGIPAVHPRYKSSYRQIYEDEPAVQTGTFGIRLFFCILLFACFVSFDKNNTEFREVNSSRIVEEIACDLDIAEVWKEL